MSDGFEWFERVTDAYGTRVDLGLDTDGMVTIWTGTGVQHKRVMVTMTYDQAITLACALSHWAIEKKKRDREARDVRPEA